jgi:glucose-6-phosphate 1-epimerase
VIHRSRHQQLETLLIDTELARCEISLFGAHVLSFVPKADGRDLLWCSPARLGDGRPVRGGVPVCWPWFAKQGVPDTAPQHGFVRTMPWTAESVVGEADGSVKVTLSVRSAFAGWPPECEPQLTVTVGSTLTIALDTFNHSSETVTLTQALHSYFRVGHVGGISIDGLQGLRYLDKIAGFAESVQQGPWRFDGSCDRIYLDAGASHAIHDPVLDRTIRIGSEGSATTVVWNPGAEGIRAFADIPPADWFQYVCVEAANCGPLDEVTLPPGQSTRIVQRIDAVPFAG